MVNFSHYRSLPYGKVQTPTVLVGWTSVTDVVDVIGYSSVISGDL